VSTVSSLLIPALLPLLYVTTFSGCYYGGAVQRLQRHLISTAHDFPRQKMRFSAAGFCIFRGVPRRSLIFQQGCSFWRYFYGCLIANCVQ